MDPKVSIVMPIYNASAFLENSLGKLLKQTLEDIEIICVNDGSTDNSLEMIQSYASNDSRIVIIDKPNGGYGHAVNKGIEIAKAEGKYKGRKKKPLPDNFNKIVQQWRNGEITARKAMKLLGMSSSTFYRNVK